MSKKTWIVIVGAALSAALLFPAVYANQLLNGTMLPFYIYHGFHSPDNHYAPSGWMGDYSDLKLDDHYALKGNKETVIRIDYTAKSTEGAGWAGIYWQHPANNWGNREGGYNLNGAKRVVFRARGAKGGETISQFKIGGIDGDYRDSGSAAIGPLELTNKWQEYTIPLDGQELSSIAGGFCVTLASSDNPNGATFYIDNIRYE